MASTLDNTVESSMVTYEQLSDIQEEFDEVEVEIIRQQVQLMRPLLEKRAKVVADIPNFWPLVFEQAPPDIDEYIQPSDSALLLSSLRSLSVSHFEAETGGDPRSVSIRFEFGENDCFEDRVIEKKFWYRRARGGWSGLVSEPVDIKWKPGKDLTKGLLAMVKKVWDEEQQQAAAGGNSSKTPPTTKPGTALTPAQAALKKNIESSGGLGGVSFFAWFGYRGKKISAEESRAWSLKEAERRRRRGVGGRPSASPAPSVNADDDDDDDDDALEVFPDGDELAICISDDIWPDAIKYFLQAQEQEDGNTDDDFESDEEDEEDGSPTDKVLDQPPTKKQRK